MEKKTIVRLYRLFSHVKDNMSFGPLRARRLSFRAKRRDNGEHWTLRTILINILCVKMPTKFVLMPIFPRFLCPLFQIEYKS